jgi:hypothetical protein
MKQHLDDLSQIRSMMERSSRFISLSGLAGVFAGSFALIGAFFAYQRILQENTGGSVLNLRGNSALLNYLIADGIIVLFAALAFSVFFTIKHSRKNGQKIWDNSSKRLMVSIVVPLVAGGIFCLTLLNHAPELIDSATLLFYGLALVNASKYTFDNVKYLGYLQILLGMLGGFADSWQLGLLYWVIGFGLGHIVYGILMYRQNKG